MKYIKYIFIVIALVVFLGPLGKIDAQGAVLGPCTVTDANRNITFQGRTTEADCDAEKIPGVNSTTWQSSSATTYQLLAPLPNPEGGTLEQFDPGQGLSVYLNLMIKMFIGLCAVLAVVMIVVGGLEYMTSELVSSKEAGKGRIRNALIGLIIALGAYALIFTINPDLLVTDPASLKPPAAESEALISNWYFESRNAAGQQMISAPFSTEPSCNTEENAVKNTGTTIVKPCFSSKDTPSITETWYFEAQDSMKNFIVGPFDTKEKCLQKMKEDVIVVNAIVTICFQSTTPPTITPPNWYFEYHSSSARANFVNGPYISSVCKAKNDEIVSPDTIVRACFQAETRPVVSRLPVKDCVFRSGKTVSVIQNTKAECERRSDSQTWNGIPTPSALGQCTFRKQSDLARTTSQTTKINCEKHGSLFISWVVGI